MGILITTAQLILSLSILIVLHEGGHFFPAKWFGVKVEKFYLFFDTSIRIFGKKLSGSIFKYKSGDTEYGIGWLPLGGYVKIAGMLDESFDDEQLAAEPKEDEFRTKPAWQRLIIMLGGVTVNFILGIFLMSMVLFVWGKEYLPAQNAKYGIAAHPLGKEIGLQNGDIITKVGTSPFTKFNEGSVIRGISIDGAKDISLIRDNNEQKIKIPDGFGKRLISETKQGNRLFSMQFPFVVGQVGKDSPAKEAGIQKGDSIILVNNIPTPYFTDFVNIVKPKKSQEITVSYVRKNAIYHSKVTTTEKGTVGLSPYEPKRYFDYQRDNFSFNESFYQGAIDSYDFLALQIKSFKKIFTGDIAASDSLGGFISIGGLFGSEWIWERFWYMTAVLSLILAFMNLLPIPLLDGGHVVFLIYEMIVGRPLPQKIMEYFMYAGLVLIAALMIFANGNDIYGLLKGCN